MTSSFEKASAYLESLGVDAMRSLSPSLHRIEALCEALDHPEQSVPAIHITGTNGKTTTARVASSLLAAAGLSVGTFTSPHLQSIRERLALNGEPLSEATFGEVFDHVFPYVELVEGKLSEKLSYFEVLTGMYLLWAAEAPVDASVVEVGLGGRWDATNVVPAQVAVITNIGLDHTDLLGRDRETIAKEKAGIIKPDSVVVVGERAPNILELIRAEAVNALLSEIENDFWLGANRPAVGGRSISVHTSAGDYEDVYLPLHGTHQATNALLALEATTRFLARPLSHDLVAEGLGRVEVPGRLETVRLEDHTVALDVAHNPEGTSAMVTSLLESFAFDELQVVFGALRDKDYRGMLSEIGRLPCSIIAAQPKSPRAVPATELCDVAEELGLACEVADSVPLAVTRGLEGAAPFICVTGSHYVVGEARAHLLGAP